MASIYEQLGGEAAIGAAVDIFYRKMLSDERVARFFDDTDMARQHAKQKAFLTMVLDGPNQYTGKDMRAAHAHLVRDKGLTDLHFDVVVEHLGATLQELGVPDALIADVAGLCETVRADVLNR